MQPERSVADRKRVFRSLVQLYEKYQFGVTDGLTHSRDFIGSVLRAVSRTTDASDARDLLEADTRITSTKQGHKILALSQHILEDKKIGKKFIDAEIIAEDTILHFEHGSAPTVFLRHLKEAVEDRGTLTVLALPGDQLFEAVYSQHYVLRLDPKNRVSEARKKKLKNKKKRKREEAKRRVQKYFIEKSASFRVPGVELTERHCAQCHLTNDQLDELFEISYGIHELDENECALIRKKISETVTSSSIPATSMRPRIIKAIAKRGVRTGTFSEEQLRVLYEWEDFLEDVLAEEAEFENFLK